MTSLGDLPRSPSTTSSGGALVPSARVAAATGIGAALLWAAVLAVDAARTHLALSLLSRPDRLLGWAGAPLGTPLCLALVVAAVLAIVFALGLRQAFRDRWLWAVFVVAMGIASLAIAVISIATPDSNMYETSPLRGLSAWLLVVAAPTVAIVAWIGLLRAGSTIAAWLSFLAGAAMICFGIDLAAVGAMAGAAQPQVESSIVDEVIVGIWLVGASLRVLAVRPAKETAVRSKRGRLALGGVGVGVGALFVGQLAAIAVSCSFLGPVVEAQASGRTQALTIDVGDVTRSYRIHRPAQLAQKPGLVIVLSGVFGSGFQAEVATSFDDQADRLGWIAIYPDSVLDGWMAYGSGPAWGNHPGADDVPFFSALIDLEIARDGVDPGHVFVTGMSRGGMMTYRAGCELADKVAAIAPVSGNMATAAGTAADVPCNPSRPVSVLAIHGTADTTIPINGGHVDISFSPLADVMAKWRSVDGCEGTAQTATDGPSTTTSWQCRDAATVAMRVVQGGWHVWPGSPLGAGYPDNFDASRLIADFFVAHARP